MTRPASIEGGCSCGAVRYRATARPLYSMVCHCRTCRRVAAAPVVAWVTFAIDRFAFVDGTPVRFASSDPVQRTFCGSCGTPITYRHAESPDTIDVTTCSLGDPGAFPPTHHSWVGHDVGWVKFGDGLPRYPESRTD
jgi:hypothetical protein